MPLVPNEYASMSSSGTRKNSPSKIVTGASSPASLRDQPRPLCSPMLGALYLGEDALVLAGRLPSVLDDLEPLEDLGFQLVTGEARERLVDLRERGIVGRVVVGVVRELGPDLGVEDVVYELVGVVRVLRTVRDAHVVRPAGRSRLGDDEVEVVVPGHREEGVAREDVPEQEVAVDHRGSVLRRVEVAAQQGLLLLELGLRFLQLLGVGGVHAVAQLVEGRSQRLPCVVEHRDLALELRVPHRVPTVYLPDLVLVVEDASGAPLVGHAVLVVGVVGEPPEVLPDVLEVGDLRLVERLDDVALDHDRDHVVRRHDNVVARGPGLELAQKVLVGGEEVLRNLYAGLLLEAGDRALGHVLRPVVEGQLLLLRAAPTPSTALLGGRVRLAGQDGERRAGHAGGAHRLEEPAPRYLSPHCYPPSTRQFRASQVTVTSSPSAGPATSCTFCW